MNRQQRRKLNRQIEKNTKNYGFSDQERNEIINCVGKIRQGLTCIGSIKPLITPAPIENDNFISFRIGLALDIVYTIDCGTIYILERIKTPDSFSNLGGLLFVNALLMRNTLRRISDLAFLWKNPQHTFEYRDHQINNERGEWAKERLGIEYKDKTEQGIISVIEEIYGEKLTNDYFKRRSDIFNDAFYGKHAIERYTELADDPDRNKESVGRTKGNVLQYIIDCYEFVSLILKGFQKYEQVTINNSSSLDFAKDTAILWEFRKQYQDQT